MAATSRPSTHHNNRSSGRVAALSEDDFLFVPPMTASSARSPRTARSTKATAAESKRTIVGIGTCGLGSGRVTKRDIHAEWLAEKGSRAPAPAPPQPPEPLSQQARKEQRERQLARLRQQIKAEKKEQEELLKAVKAESAQFVDEFTAEQRKREAEIRNSAKALREQEGEAPLSDPSVYPLGSPQRAKAEMLEVVREDAKHEGEVWRQMRADQKRVNREHVTRTHDMMQKTHDAAKQAYLAAEEKRREAAEAQREWTSQYRSTWQPRLAELRTWQRNDVRSEQAAESARRQKRREQLTLPDVDVDKVKAKHDARQRALDAVRREEREKKAEVVKAVKGSLQYRRAMEELREARRRKKAEINHELSVLQRLRSTDAALEFEQRRAMHDEVVRSSSARNSPNRSPPVSPRR